MRFCIRSVIKCQFIFSRHETIRPKVLLFQAGYVGDKGVDLDFLQCGSEGGIPPGEFALYYW